MSFLKSNKVLNHPEKYSQWYKTGDTLGPITVKPMFAITIARVA